MVDVISRMLEVEPYVVIRSAQGSTRKINKVAICGLGVYTTDWVYLSKTMLEIEGFYIEVRK